MHHTFVPFKLKCAVISSNFSQATQLRKLITSSHFHILISQNQKLTLILSYCNMINLFKLQLIHFFYMRQCTIKSKLTVKQSLKDKYNYTQIYNRISQNITGKLQQFLYNDIQFVEENEDDILNIQILPLEDFVNFDKL